MRSIDEKLDVLIERTDMLMRDTLPGALIDSLFPGQWHHQFHGGSTSTLTLRSYVPPSRGYLEIELILGYDGSRVWCKRFSREEAAG